MNTAELIGLLEDEIKKFGGWKLAVASDYTDESDFPAFTELVNGICSKDSKDNQIVLTTGNDGKIVTAEDFLDVLKKIQELYGEADLRIEYPEGLKTMKCFRPGLGAIREVRFFINEIQLVI